MSNYLITGGAGFLGINLCRYLLERGHQVVSLDIADFDYPERDRITEIKGDIRHPATVDRAMQGIDFVIHCAAALPLYSKPISIQPTWTAPGMYCSLLLIIIFNEWYIFHQQLYMACLIITR